MTVAEWGLLVGALTSLALAVGPWMFKVHAQLAVIAARLSEVCEAVAQAHADHRRLWETTARHETRLDAHDLQLAHVAERRARD
jgi:hypothetical protein